MVNTIELDPQRASLILQAWEFYATGDYTLDHLAATMADLGLASRPTAKSSAKPLSRGQLHRMLNDPYYAGFVVYEGNIYPGRHEPIVGQDLYERVQEVMEIRSRRGNRDRVHNHFLKGMLFCDRCHTRGITSRLIFTEAVGKGGAYHYFFCRLRKEGSCDLPYIPIERVEDSLQDHYATLSFPEGFIEYIRSGVNEALNDEQGSIRDIHAKLNNRLKKLEEQEERLVDLAADGTLPQQTIRAKLHQIQLDKNKIQASLATTTAQLKVGADVLLKALELVKDPAALYERVHNPVRRLMTQSFFEQIYVDDRGGVSTDLAPPFTDLAAAKVSWGVQDRSDGVRTNERRPRDAGTPTRSIWDDVHPDQGSNKTYMVELRGIEPLTFSLRTKRSTN